LKRTFALLSLTLLLLGSLSTLSAQGASDATVLVWTGNGGYHVEIDGFIANCTEWGYTVTNATSELNASLLEGVDILIVNGPDFMLDSEITAAVTWFEAAKGRAIWVAGESDYGGYWYPHGGASNKGVNHLLMEIGAHIYIQDDAVNDAVENDGSGYRVLPNTPNTVDDVAKDLTEGVTYTSMHGPTAVIAYSSVTAEGLGTVANFDDIENCVWVMNTSTTGSIADQDFDDDEYWEGFPVGINMSLTMAAAEWDLGDNKGRVFCSGESFFADYKEMFGKVARYRDPPVALQSVEFTKNVLDWFAAGMPSAPAPGFEAFTAILTLALIPAVVRRFRK
jgi:hypothetical protein